MIVSLPLGGFLDVDESKCNKCQGPREEWVCDRELFDLVMRLDTEDYLYTKDYLYYGNVCIRCFVHMALKLNKDKELEADMNYMFESQKTFGRIPFTGPFTVDFNSMTVFSEYNDLYRRRFR